jgi:hypothetical protein
MSQFVAASIVASNQTDCRKFPAASTNAPILEAALFPAT